MRLFRRQIRKYLLLLERGVTCSRELIPPIPKSFPKYSFQPQTVCLLRRVLEGTFPPSCCISWKISALVIVQYSQKIARMVSYSWFKMRRKRRRVIILLGQGEVSLFLCPLVLWASSSPQYISILQAGAGRSLRSLSSPQVTQPSTQLFSFQALPLQGSVLGRAALAGWTFITYGKEQPASLHSLRGLGKARQVHPGFTCTCR